MATPAARMSSQLFWRPLLQNQPLQANQGACAIAWWGSLGTSAAALNVSSRSWFSDPDLLPRRAVRSCCLFFFFRLPSQRRTLEAHIDTWTGVPGANIRNACTRWLTSWASLFSHVLFFLFFLPDVCSIHHLASSIQLNCEARGFTLATTRFSFRSYSHQVVSSHLHAFLSHTTASHCHDWYYSLDTGPFPSSSTQ